MPRAFGRYGSIRPLSPPPRFKCKNVQQRVQKTTYMFFSAKSPAVAAAVRPALLCVRSDDALCVGDPRGPQQHKNVKTTTRVSVSRKILTKPGFRRRASRTSLCPARNRRLPTAPQNPGSGGERPVEPRRNTAFAERTPAPTRAP